MTHQNIWLIIHNHKLTSQMKDLIILNGNVDYITNREIGFRGTEKERDTFKEKVDNLIRQVDSNYTGCGHVNIF